MGIRSPEGRLRDAGGFRGHHGRLRHPASFLGVVRYIGSDAEGREEDIHRGGIRFPQVRRRVEDDTRPSRGGRPGGDGIGPRVCLGRLRYEVPHNRGQGLLQDLRRPPRIASHAPRRGPCDLSRHGCSVEGAGGCRRRDAGGLHGLRMGCSGNRQDAVRPLVCDKRMS